MYRRYSQVGEGSVPLSQVNRNRIKNVVIFVLLAAVAALLVIGIPLMKDREETRTSYIRRIQVECDEAARLAATLSRNAGADSASMLSRIRCNIYTVRTLNTLSASTGGILMEDERMLTLLNTVDRFLSFLTQGMDTGEYTTSLQNGLAELQQVAENLR